MSDPIDRDASRHAEIALRQLFDRKPALGDTGNENHASAELPGEIAEEVPSRFDKKRYLAQCFDMAVSDILRHLGPREMAAINAHLPPIALRPHIEDWDMGFWWNVENSLERGESEGAGSLDRLRAHLKLLYYEMDSSKTGGWLSTRSQRFLYDFRDLVAAVNHWGPEMERPVVTQGWSKFIDSLDRIDSSHVDHESHRSNQKDIRGYVRELSGFLQAAQNQDLLAPRTALGGPFQSASWTGRAAKPDQASYAAR